MEEEDKVQKAVELGLRAGCLVGTIAGLLFSSWVVFGIYFWVN